VPDNELVSKTLTTVLFACDVVLGAASTGLAILVTWLYATGQTGMPTVVAMWSIPVINWLWSKWSGQQSRTIADSLRALVCLPITTFLYGADAGVFGPLWLPALIMTVGICLSLGIATRRAILGCVTATAFGGTLVGAGALSTGAVEFAALSHAVGIWMTGSLISIVASRLGRSLDEAKHQRDSAREQKLRAETTLEQLKERTTELTAAIESQHREIELRVRMELELRQAQKLESVGRLAAGVAHEINTPVQFVSDSVNFVREAVGDLFGVIDKLGFAAAETLQDVDLPYLKNTVPEALDRAAGGLDRNANIVRSMKAFAHPDSTEMQHADLKQAIESTLTIAHNEYVYLADIETEFCDLSPIECHIGELNQVILNLVVNAAHAIEDVVKGTGRKGQIRVQTRRAGGDVIISVSDTGSGIPEDVRDRIFDPFFTTKSVGRGSGQGLAIARSVIVDKHGGELTFTTAIGNGTTFFIRLPIRATTLAAAA
jgi:signal transduction histidine kinase